MTRTHMRPLRAPQAKKNPRAHGPGIAALSDQIRSYRPRRTSAKNQPSRQRRTHDVDRLVSCCHERQRHEEASPTRRNPPRRYRYTTTFASSFPLCNRLRYHMSRECGPGHARCRRSGQVVPATSDVRKECRHRDYRVRVTRSVRVRGVANRNRIWDTRYFDARISPVATARRLSPFHVFHRSSASRISSIDCFPVNASRRRSSHMRFTVATSSECSSTSPLNTSST